eukprot:m.38289 g.38289  ORF g.38289 m.38289 type:complete len:903 (-) comp17881_c1_seq1:87-2795(-)
MDELRAVIGASLSQDAQQREQALAWLQLHQAQNLPGLMQLLAQLMMSPNEPTQNRTLAGLQLKNCLSSRDEDEEERKHDIWRKVDIGVRDQIKKAAIETLGTENRRPSTSAQVIAEIAKAEIQHNMWPDVITNLLTKLNTPVDDAKISSLEALGYICEEVEPQHLVQHSNQILTAVVHHMRAEETNVHIKKAAIMALESSLAFCKANFENKVERDTIMTYICSATQTDNIEIKVPALQCLVTTVELYYHHMKDYMQHCYLITHEAMKHQGTDGEESLVLQGIEFWNTLCDKEIELKEDLIDRGGDAAAAAAAGMKVSMHYAKGAHSSLVPILLELLICQDDEDDPDQWGPTKAAVICLELFSSVCRDKVLPLVIRFVETNLKADTWQKRDAALLAFSAVLKHARTEPECVTDVVNRAILPVLELMQDQSVIVRDSLAFLVGRICDEVPGAVLDSQPHLEAVYKCLRSGLGMEPRVATNACWGLNVLSDSAFEHACNTMDESLAKPKTYKLSPVFGAIVADLFQVMLRPDVSKHNLLAASYEAISTFINSAPEDCYQTVQQTTVEILKRLDQSLHHAAQITSKDDLMKLAETQSLMCAVLQACVKGLSRENMESISDQVMEIVLKILQNPSGSMQEVKEDALMTIVKLAESLGPTFEKYCSHVQIHIIAGLKNTAEYHACGVCVGLVGDIARAIKIKILPFCDDYVSCLIMACKDADLDRSVKPNILSCFSDIAMGIGPLFEKYYEATSEMLFHASKMAEKNTSVESPTDYDEIDHINDLREGCLDGYTGIVHALKGDDEKNFAPQVKLIAQQIQHLVSFITAIFHDAELSDSNKRAALGLLGDIAEIFTTDLANIMPATFCNQCVALGYRSKDSATIEITKFAEAKFASIRPAGGMYNNMMG